MFETTNQNMLVSLVSPFKIGTINYEKRWLLDVLGRQVVEPCWIYRSSLDSKPLIWSNTTNWLVTLEPPWTMQAWLSPHKIIIWWIWTSVHYHWNWSWYISIYIRFFDYMIMLKSMFFIPHEKGNKTMTTVCDLCNPVRHPSTSWPILDRKPTWLFEG